MDHPFWANVAEPNDDGCMLFTGFIDKDGYGSYTEAKITQRAHRVAWELFYEDFIDEDHEIDHLCRTRACVNPDHLEQVSRSENQRRRDESRGEGLYND